MNSCLFSAKPKPIDSALWSDMFHSTCVGEICRWVREVEQALCGFTPLKAKFPNLSIFVMSNILF
jgi:hypothetical protein